MQESSDSDIQSGSFMPEPGNYTAREIMEGIRCAELIQRALLPPGQLLQKLLGEHFILFMPKQVVSGDFYWITQKNRKTYIVVADCTGHGIPGALMSILGISFLNEIVKTGSSDMAGHILNRLREKVMKALNQTGEFNESKDGMDLSLCIINNDMTNLQFAGANNPVYIVRDETLLEIKADKMPVGINALREEPFSSRDIEISKNDMIYMFTDGFPDQFGGPAGKKFKYRPFKKLLIDLHQRSMKDQHNVLRETFNSWLGDHEQVDDVLLLGFKIT
jgi:serine phosphatase RsbU (regulator of sigma subunit)